MHYQIFIPGATEGTPEALAAVGLADLFQGAEFEKTDGPGDAAGLICAWRRPGKFEIGFRPGYQEWTHAIPFGGLPAERYWIGFWNDSPPTPSDLARPYPQIGPAITFGDGNEWIVPAAKQLSADVMLADDGGFRFEVQRLYHGFYLEYKRWLERLAGDGSDGTFSYADAAVFVLSALRINYRLPCEVNNHLRMLSTHNIQEALLAILTASKPTAGTAA